MCECLIRAVSTADVDFARSPGVIDDRGKFIYIPTSELEAVAAFIRRRGRVSLADLVENSNSLISLTPEVTQAS